MKKPSSRTSIFLFLLSLTAVGCGPNAGILNSNRDAPDNVSTQPTRSQFERDLEAVKTANFEFVWIFRRKDGGKFDADDRAAFRSYTQNVNRRIVSDDDKAIIVGSNYPIEPASMTALAARFQIEDQSKPGAAANANINAGPAANANAANK